MSKLISDEGFKLIDNPLSDVEIVANQKDSAASTVAALVADFNALLAKLKAAGIMAPDAE